MNSDQFQSLIRTILKIISGLLIAHGMSDTASVLNTPDVLGALTLIISVIWSHFSHASTPTAPGGSSKTGAPLLLVAISVMLAGVLLTGCTGTPNKVAFQAAGVTNLSVDNALSIYDQFAAAGKTTAAQNLAVKKAWEKYHAAYLMALDAGKVASASTNNAAFFASSMDDVAFAKADLMNLLASFGIIKQ